MPIYTFISVSGESVEELVPAGTREIDRDGTKFKRGELPENFALTGTTPEKPFSEKMRAGYYKAECEGGSNFNSGFSKSKIKRVWGL